MWCHKECGKQWPSNTTESNVSLHATSCGPLFISAGRIGVCVSNRGMISSERSRRGILAGVFEAGGVATAVFSFISGRIFWGQFR